MILTARGEVGIICFSEEEIKTQSNESEYTVILIGDRFPQFDSGSAFLITVAPFKCCED